MDSSQKRKSKSLLSHWKFLSSQVQLAQPPSSGQLILAMPGYRPIIPFENLHLVDLKPQVMGLRIGYSTRSFMAYRCLPCVSLLKLPFDGHSRHSPCYVHPFSTHPYVASEAQKEGPRGDKRISAGHATWLQRSNSSDEQVVRKMKTCVIQKDVISCISFSSSQFEEFLKFIWLL